SSFLLPAYGGSATWNLNPTTGDWNTAANWTPATVPNGPNDVATFGVSTITSITIPESFEVDSMVFNPGASSFTIGNDKHVSFTVSGAGIINNSGLTENLLVAQSSVFAFFGTASAGQDVSVIVPGSTGSG